MSRDAKVVRSLPGHPMIRLLRRTVGADVALSFMAIIIWASGKGGRLGNITRARLAMLAEWEANPDHLFKHLIEAGAITVDDDGLVSINDWQDYYPQLMQDDERAAVNRANRIRALEQKSVEPVEPVKPAEPAEPVERIEQPEKLVIPFVEIVALYHKHLKDNPSVRVISNVTKSNIRARWNEDKLRQSLGWWDEYFAYAASCPHLIGQTGDDNHRPFFADFAWLVGPKNMEKVINGRYEP